MNFQLSIINLLRMTAYVAGMMALWTAGYHMVSILFSGLAFGFEVSRHSKVLTLLMMPVSVVTVFVIAFAIIATIAVLDFNVFTNQTLSLNPTFYRIWPYLIWIGLMLWLSSAFLIWWIWKSIARHAQSSQIQKSNTHRIFEDSGT